MDGPVKQAFGVLMLALAAWVLTRIGSARFNLLLFAVPVFAAAIVLWNLRGAQRTKAAPPDRCGAQARPAAAPRMALHRIGTA